MKRPLLTTSFSITVLVVFVLLLTGCSSLIIHSDDNVAVVAGKVAVRTVNCALTIFIGCASELIWMDEAKAQSMVWVGNGDVRGDNYKCQQEASSSSSGAPGYIHIPVGKNVMSVPMDGGGGRQINQQLYYSCMSARGYSLIDGYEYSKSRMKEANKGSHCVASNATVGTRVRTPEGKMVKITALHGNSSGCPNPVMPIGADVEEVGEKESPGSASQSQQDSIAAQVQLGLQYYNGQGVPRDYGKARQLWEQAATQGNSWAQNNLGLLYQNGQGVPQDYGKARQWYEKAAAQGNSDAQTKLRQLTTALNKPAPIEEARMRPYEAPSQMDRELTGKDGAPMALVPAGEFLYGRTKQKITLSAFYMDLYEVTVSRYAAYIQATDRGQPKYWKDMRPATDGALPVVGVDWGDADAYCQFYGKRLPSEQEWEKAARGTDGRLYPWGNNSPTTALANYGPAICGPFCNVYEEKLKPVNSYEEGRSPYGMHHMAGNAWEWVEQKTLRGGSWAEYSIVIRSTTEVNLLLTVVGADKIGFRCAQDAR